MERCECSRRQLLKWQYAEDRLLVFLKSWVSAHYLPALQQKQNRALCFGWLADQAKLIHLIQNQALQREVNLKQYQLQLMEFKLANTFQSCAGNEGSCNDPFYDFKRRQS